MSVDKQNIPQADTLMGSMRSMGYSFESAIADVVDNSISAHCNSVRILFPKEYNDVWAVGILDDGDGMCSENLFEAMRYGSADSELERDDLDLGRFGLGMKSASLSQCKILTVVSKTSKECSAYTWDFNYIKKKKAWIVQEYSKDEIEQLPYIDGLKALDHGTLVLWRDFDVIEKSSDGQVFNTLCDKKKEVDAYLSLIFHRYLSAKGAGKLAIYINNSKVKPQDPFLESHPKTTMKKERTIALIDSNGVERQITVKPFILPFATDLSDDDKKLLGGIEYLRAKQGFYVYRNHRLIIWGTWFGMKPRSELTKNARIRVDIPNSLDDIWGIDIKKQTATIPKRIQNQLKKTVMDAMEISVNKQTHRGRRENVDDIDYIWDRMEGRNNTFYYQINRESKVFQMIKEKMSDEDYPYLEMLISEIEKNFPIQQMYIDKSNEVISDDDTDTRFDDVYQLAVTMLGMIKSVGERPIGEIITDIMKSEPFCKYPVLKDKLVSEYKDEIN